jgi:hypothetical protein
VVLLARTCRPVTRLIAELVPVILGSGDLELLVAEAAAAPSPDGAGLPQPSDSTSRDLLDRYMAAFTAMDVEALEATLRGCAAADAAIPAMVPGPGRDW